MTNEPSNHAVKNDSRITLRDKFQCAIFNLYCRKIIKVGSHKIPRGIITSASNVGWSSIRISILLFLAAGSGHDDAQLVVAGDGVEAHVELVHEQAVALDVALIRQLAGRRNTSTLLPAVLPCASAIDCSALLRT